MRTIRAELTASTDRKSQYYNFSFEKEKPFEAQNAPCEQDLSKIRFGWAPLVSPCFDSKQGEAQSRSRRGVIQREPQATPLFPFENTDGEAAISKLPNENVVEKALTMSISKLQNQSQNEERISYLGDLSKRRERQALLPSTEFNCQIGSTLQNQGQPKFWKNSAGTANYGLFGEERKTCLQVIDLTEEESESGKESEITFSLKKRRTQQRSVILFEPSYETDVKRKKTTEESTLAPSSGSDLPQKF